VNCSSIGPTAKSVTATVTEMTLAVPKAKPMLKITTNFDSRKFQRDLENEVRDAAEKQIRSKLSDLTARGLRISFRPGGTSSLNVNLDGPDDLIEEAERRLS
jgi:hypothetical protein